MSGSSTVDLDTFNGTLAQLTALGATLFQGYLYGRPMALAEIDRWFLSCAFAAAPSEVPETPVTP